MSGERNRMNVILIYSQKLENISMLLVYNLYTNVYVYESGFTFIKTLFEIDIHYFLIFQ